MFHLRGELGVGECGVSANERTFLRLRRGPDLKLVPNQHNAPEIIVRRSAPNWHELQSKRGNFVISSGGTGSSGSPAFFQARKPPLMTAARTPFSSRRRATRTLVASPRQVQYK